MDDLIYNQHRIPKAQWRYGLRTSADTGCGWIATYNALRLLGYRAAPEELIRYFEHQVPLINGNVGTFLPGPAVFFKQQGFPVEVSLRRDRFDALAKASDVCIVFYYWRRKYKVGAHFVVVRHRDGKFTGYNTFRNSDGPDDWGASLEGFLDRNKFFGPVLIGIRDKRK